MVGRRRRRRNVHLHLSVAFLFPPDRLLGLPQPLLHGFQRLRVHAAALCVVLHDSRRDRRSETHAESLSLGLTAAGYLDVSLWASSNAALRDFRSWSASSSLTFKTASWPSLADKASLRSSTCERRSRNARSFWACSEFHRSARRRAWFSSEDSMEDRRDQLRERRGRTARRWRLFSFTLLQVFGSLNDRRHLLVEGRHLAAQQLVLQAQAGQDLAGGLLRGGRRGGPLFTGILKNSQAGVWTVRCVFGESEKMRILTHCAGKCGCLGNSK